MILRRLAQYVRYAVAIIDNWRWRDAFRTFDWERFISSESVSPSPYLKLIPKLFIYISLGVNF